MARAATVKIKEVTYELDEENKTAKVKKSSKAELVCIIPDRVKVNGVYYRVTGIGKKAFSGCAYLDTVAIPDSIERIEDYAFKGCKALSRIKIPEGAQVAETAFAGCKSLNG